MTRQNDPVNDPNRPRTPWELEGRQRRRGEYASDAVKPPRADHIPVPDFSDQFEGLSEEDRIRVIMGRIKRENTEEPVVRKPWFDWTLSWSVVVTIILAFFGVLWMGVNGLRQYQADISTIYQTINQRDEAASANVNKLTSAIADVRADLSQQKTTNAEYQKAAEVRAATNIPKIEAMQENNKVQDERIQNISIAVSQLREVVNDLAKISTQTHEDMSILKTQIQMRAPSGPHGENAMPAKEKLGLAR